MTAAKTIPMLFALLMGRFPSTAQNNPVQVDTIPYATYPLVLDIRPDLPSPCVTKNGEEYVIAVTHEQKYAIMRVTLNNDHEICPQWVVDTMDFPHLARNGLHAEETLDTIRSITGRSTERITALGQPNGLSHAGFLADDENIITVIQADNRIVRIMGCTHPQLAKPLFHVLNMMEADLALGRWNMAKHQWDNIRYFYYNKRKVFALAEDSKGGQRSIFNDSIEGGFHIKLWRVLDTAETNYLKQHYRHLSASAFDDLATKLSVIHTGEMQPQYIMRYGFYEGHTFWRTDPVAIACIFGILGLPELDRLFKHNVYNILSGHHTE